MFRKDLEKRLKRIFGVKKVSFAAPGESFEQDCIFVHITQSVNRITEGKAIAKAMGTLTVFSQGDKLPYGFFSKKIQQAKPEDTKDLFFFEMDTDIPTSPARLQNIHERRTGFMLLWSAQYDPNQGSLTQVDFGG